MHKLILGNQATADMCTGTYELHMYDITIPIGYCDIQYKQQSKCYKHIFVTGYNSPSINVTSSVFM